MKIKQILQLFSVICILTIGSHAAAQTYEPPSPNEYDTNSLTRQYDTDKDGNLDVRGLDPRSMDETWFPSWRLNAPNQNDGDSGSMCGYASGNQLFGGNHFVCGIIGQNYDGNLVMSFFNRFSEILIKFVAPIALFFVIQAVVGMIIVTDSSRRAAIRESFLNGIIGLGLIIIAYSLIKVVFFFLTQ
jgi:hypothetical protein